MDVCLHLYLSVCLYLCSESDREGEGEGGH